MSDVAGMTLGPWEAFTVAEISRLRGIPNFYVAPDIPDAVIQGALRTYLRLEPNELLLAIIDPSGGARPSRSVALTSRRACWAEPSKRARRSAGAGRNGPTAAGPNGLPGAENDPDLDHLSQAQRDAMNTFLHSLSQAGQGGQLPSHYTPDQINWAGRALPEIAERTAHWRTTQGEKFSFARDVMASTPRVIATPLIVAICVGVFLIMGISGVSWTAPNGAALLAWGANEGELVILEHQWWRPITCMFLHFGVIHLSFNMWCLITAGPLVERLFGNAAFAMIYFLSGVGGSLASLAMHPTHISAGASGAIFGVFGALLGFLLIHRHTIPPSVFKPMRSSAVGFVVYNVLFGAFMPFIDNSAHLGGLATGFVCGLLMQRPVPAQRDVARTLRRFAFGGLVAAALAGAGLFIAHRLAREFAMPSNPVAGQRAATAYNELMRELSPLLRDYLEIEAALGSREQAEIERPQNAPPPETPPLPQLLDQAGKNLAKLQTVAPANPDLKAMVADVTMAQQEQLEALRNLERGKARTSEAEDSHRRVARELAERFLERRNAFLKKYGLVSKSNPNADQPDAEQ